MKNRELKHNKRIRIRFAYLIFILHSAFFIFPGCRSQKRIVTVPVETQTIIRERLVEVSLPADSTLMNAWFECDSNYNVLLKRFDEHKSAGMTTSMSMAAGALSYRVIRVPDTLYIPARDSIVYKEIPIPVEVPIEVNRLTGWQHFQIWTGRLLLVFFILYIAYNMLRN